MSGTVVIRFGETARLCSSRTFPLRTQQRTSVRCTRAAHAKCYIASSGNFPVDCAPEIVVSA